MSDISSNVFRYLPVSVGDRTLGIPFASIKRVLRWSELGELQPEKSTQAGVPPDESAVMVNLTQLLTGQTHVGAHTDVVIVEAMSQTIALVVDGVAPVKVVEAESYYVLPAVFSIELSLFGAVVRDQDRLVLIIEPSHLGQLLDPKNDS